MSQTTLLPLKVFCCGVVYLLCQVTLSYCEVTWVTRNVTDSFRIGEDGCLKNESVCTLHHASCQDDGSCLCNVSYPHFRNPITVLGTSLSYGSSYGCITKQLIAISNPLLDTGKGDCQFKPFQVIPNDQEEAATKFVHNNHDSVFKSCNFTSLEAKYINNRTRSMVASVDETYVQLNTSVRILYFQWRKSVLELQGLMITINLKCTSNEGSTSTSECLQAKVLGTWRSSSAVKPSNSAQTTNSTISNITSTPTNASLTSKSSHSPTLTTRNTMYSTTAGPNDTSSSNKSDHDIVVITVAAVVPPIVLIIILLMVVFCSTKRRKGKKEISNGSTSQENNAGTTGSDNIDSQSQPACSTIRKDANSDSDLYAVPDHPDIERIMVNGDTYAVVNKNKTTKKPKKEPMYMDPENLQLDETKLDVDQSSEPTEYANIVGVMQKDEEE